MNAPLSHLVRISLRKHAAQIAYAMRADYRAIKQRSNPERFNRMYPAKERNRLIRSRLIALCGWHTFATPSLSSAMLHHCAGCDSLHDNPQSVARVGLHTPAKLLSLCVECAQWEA